MYSEPGGKRGYGSWSISIKDVRRRGDTGLAGSDASNFVDSITKFC